MRLSRAVGLPGPLPDIQGVAVRLETPGGPADLLFATTGSGRFSRYLLLLRRSPHVPMTTLLPVRTVRGPLQLRLVPEVPAGGVRSWVLGAARPRDSRWAPIGRLVADAEPVGPDPDPPVRFEPVGNVPTGTAQYRWVRLLRGPAYVLARRWSPAGSWR